MSLDQEKLPGEKASLSIFTLLDNSEFNHKRPIH